jgi:hypothetical protein
MTEKDEIPLYDENDEVCDYINPKLKDLIFLQSFEEMMNEAYTEGKHFFVARVEQTTFCDVTQ